MNGPTAWRQYPLPDRAEVPARGGVEVGLRRHLPFARRVLDEAAAHAVDRLDGGDRLQHGVVGEDRNLRHAVTLLGP